MEVELGLVKDVMKISQVSKENKSAIYDNKNIQLIAIKQKKLKKNARNNIRNHSVITNTTKDTKDNKQNQ